MSVVTDVVCSEHFRKEYNFHHFHHSVHCHDTLEVMLLCGL
uniref:Uncharacterized protein n=1 Tax=Anguilla anguilla TaxID=7936 RepID=A0A0E9VU63_ANGAN